MKPSRDERGYSYVLFLWILAAAVLAVSAFTFFRIYKNSGLAGHTASHCSIQSGVQLCVAGVPDRISASTTRTLSVTLTNKSQKTYSWSGSSSCGAEPALDVNDRSDRQTCTADIVPYRLKPNEAWKATLQLDGTDLNAGANSLQVHWGGIVSEKLTVKRSGK